MQIILTISKVFKSLKKATLVFVFVYSRFASDKNKIKKSLKDLQMFFFRLVGTPILTLQHTI